MIKCMVIRSASSATPCHGQPDKFRARLVLHPSATENATTMGSFNTSCFVSRQTIAPGDPCIVIPIRQERTHHEVELTFHGNVSRQCGPYSSPCYPTRYWTPAGAFFEAKYVDRHEMRLADTVNNRVYLHVFLQDVLTFAPTVTQGENSAHDHAFNLMAFILEHAPSAGTAVLQVEASEAVAAAWPDEVFAQLHQCWNYIAERVFEQRVFLADYFGMLRPASFAVMHKAAFLALVRHTDNAVDLRGASLSMEAQLRQRLPDLQKRKDKVLERMRHSPLAQFAAGPEAADALTVSFFVQELREALEHLGSPLGSLRYPAETPLLERAARSILHAPDFNERDLLELLRPALEVRYACMALDDLNVHFEPMVVTGQDYDNSIGQQYAAFVAEVSSVVTAGRNTNL